MQSRRQRARREAVANEGRGHRDGRRQGIISFSESDRLHAMARGVGWTTRQATRLGIAESELLEAIRERGWLPEQIQELPAAESRALLGLPPMLNNVYVAVDTQWDAEVWRRARQKIAARRTRKAA